MTARGSHEAALSPCAASPCACSHRAAALYSSPIVLVTLRLFPLITPEWYMPSADVLLASVSIHASCADATVDPGNKVQTGDGRS